MHKIKYFGMRAKDRVLGWSLLKKIIYGLIILLVIFTGFKFFGPKDPTKGITTDTVKLVDLSDTVLATGQVVSSTDLDLSFYKSGTVRSVQVAVGNKVGRGAVLATLEGRSELAALTSARGTMAAAEARYKKILDGASNEEVRLSEIALENARREYDRTKSQQETLIENAYKNVLNSTPEARPNSATGDYVAPTISGNYTKGIEGDILVSVYQTGTGTMFSLTGIVTGGGQATGSTPQSLADSGLYITFSGVDLNGVREWKISIPNKKASNYVTNYNAYQSAIRTKDSAMGSAQSLIDQRTAELALKKSSARSAEVDLAKADILSAQGNLQAAGANYEHTILRAPAKGTITKVDIKYGELADAGKTVVVLEDVENLYIEALINESDIALLKIGQSVNISFDAFGGNKKVGGVVAQIDPSAEASDGVVNYKIKVALSERDPAVRPGMNANIEIMAGQASGVLSIPLVAVYERDDKSYVQILINKKRYEEREVTTGFTGDNNLIEITSGLSLGDEVALNKKQ